MLYWFRLNPSKSKYQVVHEPKFKDLLSSTCQVSVERIVLDLESEAMRGQGIFLFSQSKEKNATIGIYLCICETP